MSLLKRIEKGGGAGGSGNEPPSRGGTPPAGESGGGGDDSRFASMRTRNAAIAGSQQAGGRNASAYFDLKSRIQSRLLSELDPTMDLTKKNEVRAHIEELFNTILSEESMVLARAERQRLFDQIVAEIQGFGPLEPLLADETITEIMVNGPKNIFVERKGNITRANVAFEDDEHVMRVLDRIVAPLGRRIDESSPLVDARLPDGSRVNAVIRPISLVGPTLTIRKFFKKPLTVEDLIRLGSLTKEIAEFLRACIIARLNTIVSGGTGSGKTTLLNILSGFIPNDERIVTIENAAELQLRQEHVVTLESRPANIEGKGAITIQDLVVNSLRMRPDRIVVGECRGGEALDMLQAMNTGHDGSLTTIHANTPRDALSRIETMIAMGATNLPERAMRQQIAAAIQIIIQQSRLSDGTRKVTAISEITGMEGDVITTQDIYVFEKLGVSAEGKVIGRFRATGVRPKVCERLKAAGIHLPPNMFEGVTEVR